MAINGHVASHQFRIKDVVDGTAKTLAFAERGVPHDFEYGWGLCGFGVNGTGNLDNLLAMELPPQEPTKFAPGGGNWNTWVLLHAKIFVAL